MNCFFPFFIFSVIFAIESNFRGEMAIITLTSDWGTSDYYAAAVKGVILSRMPNATIVDITHQIDPFNIAQAGFTLHNCFRNFPEGTIHIIAVETIESDINPHVVVKAHGHYFISTDNGKTFKTIPKTDMVGESTKPFTGLAVLPSDARVIYVTNESCLAISYDCGLQWTLAEDVHLRKIYHNPLVENSLVGFSRDLSDNCHYHYSTDGGYQWSDCKHIYEQLGNISEIYDAAFHPTKVGRIIASGLSRYSISDDSGATWTHLAEPKHYQPIIFTTDVEYDKRNPDIVYATDLTSNSTKTLCIFRSTDGGYTWETFYKIDNPNGHALSISIKDNLLAIYSYAKGIYLLDVDEVASISPVTSDAALIPYYDLQGRPVAAPTRGVYIKDGRKVIFK